MSDQQPYPGQPYPTQPQGGQPYGGQPYGGRPYAGQLYPGQPYPTQPAYPYGQPGYPYGGPALRYEPLPRRHKRAALWAGGIGLNLMSLGGNILVGLILVALFVALFASISASAGTGSGLQGFDEFLGDVNAPLWGLGIAAAGFVIFLLGMFASFGILRRAEVRRPWAVTWSAFAITILPLIFVNFLLSAVGQILASVGGFAIAGASGTDDPLAILGGVGIASVLGFLLLTVAVVWVIGALTWWWMAHAFRERVVASGQDGSRSYRRDSGGDAGGAAIYGGGSHGSDGGADGGGGRGGDGGGSHGGGGWGGDGGGFGGGGDGGGGGGGGGGGD